MPANEFVKMILVGCCVEKLKIDQLVVSLTVALLLQIRKPFSPVLEVLSRTDAPCGAEAQNFWHDA